MNHSFSSFRIVLLGDIAVGKSSVALSLRLEIWDTAGQERYDSIAPIYYRGSDSALVVYDITNVATYERAKRWVKRLQSEVDGILIYLVGNKVDLVEKRAVETREAAEYAQGMGVDFKETSAMTSEGIADLFSDLTDKLLQRPPKPLPPGAAQIAGGAGTSLTSTDSGAASSGGCC